MTEVRKVQQVGRSTIVVAIPKKWAREASLKPGEAVTVERSSNGVFKIIPRSAEGRGVFKCTIDADSCITPSMLVRALTGNYLLGRDVIEVVSKKGLEVAHLEQIRSATQRLTGLGIVEHTSSRVVIQDFIDPARFSFENLIKRIFQLISSLQESVEDALVGCGSHIALDVHNLEDEVDSIYWLTIRQLLMVANNSMMGVKIGVSPQCVVDECIIVKSLKEIADHYESICRLALDVVKTGLKPGDKDLKELMDYNKQLQNIMGKIIPTYFSKDMVEANSLIEDVGAYSKNIGRFAKNLREHVKDTVLVADLSFITWNLDNVAGNCKSILESVINECMACSGGVCELSQITPSEKL